MGSTYLKKRDQIINVEKLDQCKCQRHEAKFAEKALKLSILPSPQYFVSSLKVFYDSIRQTFLAPGGGGGSHPAHPPAYRPGYLAISKKKLS